MNPDIPTPSEPVKSASQELAERNAAIAQVQERYLARAKSEEDFSEAIPEPYPGAKSQTQVAVARLRRLAGQAEQIYDHETSLAGKSPEELRSVVVQLESAMNQLVGDQRQVQSRAREYQLGQDAKRQPVDQGVIAQLDQEEVDILDRSSLMLELKDITRARLKKAL
jgi:ElaB/YqjD/DUF883 family membrane-anchored ribosome-binding protein